jgi:hypothetical protein
MEATNFGVEQARGERISMLHVDDLWLPNRCAMLRDWLSERPDGIMHLHPCYIMDGSGRRLGLSRCPLPVGPSPVAPALLLERLLVQNFIAVPTPTIRRDAYLSVGGLDKQLWYTADWDLYLKLALVGNVYYHSCPLTCYRVHKNSLTIVGSRKSENFREQQQIVVDRHAGQLSPARRRDTLRAAVASIDVNTALAAVNNGDFTHVTKAVRSLLALGPLGINQYFTYSRILERALPRLRAVVGGTF